MLCLSLATFWLVHGQEQEPLPAPSNPWFHNTTLYWDEVAGADLYLPRRIQGQRVLILSVPDSETQISYSDLEDGASYEFSVRAADSSDRSRDSEWSSAVQVRFFDYFCVATILNNWIRFPSSGFISGRPDAYRDDQCEGDSDPYRFPFEDGLVYTRHGVSQASLICTRANDDGTIYSAERSVHIPDGDGWLSENAVDILEIGSALLALSATPTPTVTNTPRPRLTDRPRPTNTRRPPPPPPTNTERPSPPSLPPGCGWETQYSQYLCQATRSREAASVASAVDAATEAARNAVFDCRSGDEYVSSWITYTLLSDAPPATASATAYIRCRIRK